MNFSLSLVFDSVQFLAVTAGPTVPVKSPQTAKTAQQTLINRDSLELGPELGQGEFGSVLKGIWRNPKGTKVQPFK